MTREQRELGSMEHGPELGEAVRGKGRVWAGRDQSRGPWVTECGPFRAQLLEQYTEPQVTIEEHQGFAEDPIFQKACGELKIHLF